MIGSRLGAWVLDRELGQGGAGTVYLAHADPIPETGSRHAAIKVLAAELAADPGFLGRFQREIEVLGRLDHPHIVKLIGSGNQNDRYYFAMEYVEGQNFEQRRLPNPKVPWLEVLDMALQVAPALKHAHDRGIIHRDIKPANLLHGQDGIVKLTDFGIASLFASRHLTAAGAVVGTAEYLSPEQAAGRLVTPRSDLYSFGVVLYTLLTGRPPFQGEILDLLQKHRFAQFDRPVRLAPEIPGDLDELVCQLMAKEPAQRPADAGVLFRQLSGLKGRLAHRGLGETGTSSPPTTIVHPGQPIAGSGPGTLMSKLMRAELEEQNRGGPVRRFFNHPVVLVLAFLACMIALVWGFWPLSPETMYHRGAALMASSDPDQWYDGWNNYLEPLQTKYPNNPHQGEIEVFQKRYEAYRSARRAARLARVAEPMSEGQWFFNLGLRQRQQGDEPAARKTWQALVQAFQNSPTEQPWVNLAKQMLDAKDLEPPPRDLESVREVIRQAEAKSKEGKQEEAKAILRGLRELYGGDREVKELLGEKSNGSINR